MDFDLTEDQTQILDAIGSLSKPYPAPPPDSRGYALTSAELDSALIEGGFLDVAFDPDLGAITAALIVEALARLPYAVEVGASALVRPLLGELPMPLCLVEARALQRPVRFLKPGATVVVLDKDKVSSFTATADDVTPTQSLFAYPMAMLASGAAARAEPLDVDPQEVRTRWRVALAVEISGLLDAAIAATITYVSERKQFGRPIGVFQAVRHRMAEASVLAAGVHWLALKAAYTGDAGDAALAAYQAQEAATQVVYDLHQFLGAMGVTLEHPLHLWTYRLKALVGDLGGGGAQAVAAAGFIWSDAAESRRA
jgi:hypothetical protein